ncbi:PPK2 family polyphosphate kinase [Nocardioides pacificus]
MRSAHLRLPPGPVTLADLPTNAAPGFAGDKTEGKQALRDLGPGLADMQEQLFARRTTDSQRRVLLVLQGMDTSGKGGVVRKAIGLVDPQGVRITSFKAPTEEERAQDFLVRIRQAVPEPGYIGVFDRSHYEDVLIARVRGLADPAEIERRYEAINEFEADLTDRGVSIVKCMLHVSAGEQHKRLLARLDDPTKHWKFHPGDIDERQLWPDYQRAYEIALERTNTEQAPWHVIPSDKKWYRNLAVASLLHEVLSGMDLDWPAADFDVKEQRARLEAEEGLA